MIWIAPSDKATATDTLERCHWNAADQFRTKSGLKTQEYFGPTFSFICLRLAKVISLAKQIQALGRTGDLLPPRLLSGNVQLPPHA